MPEDQLFAHRVADVVQRKAPGVLLDIRVEEDLQQHITQLFPHHGGIVPVERFADLVGLLQKIAPDGLVRLCAVPRAAARGAEQMHKTHQIFKAIAVFANKIYHNSASFARVFLKFFRADAGASRFFHPWAAGGSPDR